MRGQEQRPHRLGLVAVPWRVDQHDRSVPPQRAAELLYALGTEDGYLLFVVDLGWDVDEWERWVVATVSTQILLPARTR